ncbi:MAG TPA: hypothetical protein VGL21_12775 [Jatrophihabitantaceae bacterium]
MELVVMIVVAFPLGYFVRDRLVAILSYVAIHSFVFSFQNMQLTREWVGGSTEAFPKNPKSTPWDYGVVNVAIYAVGLGLVVLGHWAAAKRQARNSAAVNLAGR